MSLVVACKICSKDAVFVGEKRGHFRDRMFQLYQCTHCHYSFIQDPDTDYASIYNESYYMGEGADPYVDYMYELCNPNQTIRRYEWSGVLKIINSLVTLNERSRWLDFGCGNGGLVRFCRRHSPANVLGFEEGWIKEKAASMAIPVLGEADLDSLKHSFDVITAIEVLEHVENPIATLKQIRSLLKPGGLFFYTTGNARPYRNRLLQWNYIVPEVHISFYEPASLELALQAAGFTCEYKSFLPGFADVIRFKVLKNLKLRNRHWQEKLLPWSLAARLINKKYQLTAHPIAWAAG